MDQEKKDKLLIQIDDSIWVLYNSVLDLAKNLSDEELLELANHYDEEAVLQSYDLYKDIALHLKAEVTFRAIFKKGAEYMERTGEKFYCVACNGKCEGHEGIEVANKDMN